MSEMERRISEERDRLRAEQTSRAAWSHSPFGTRSAAVDTPAGEFATFVNEIKPLIPRNLWRVGYMGTCPDGLTRVTWERKFLGEHKKTGGVVERRARGLSRCKAYGVEVNGYLFVVLEDGRAGYTGNLSFWRQAIVEAIASGDRAYRLVSVSETPWCFE
jgi:hypothetical protein